MNNDSFKPNYFYEIGEDGVNKKIEALEYYENALREFPHPRSRENIQALSIYRGCQAKMRYAEAFVIAFEREKNEG